MKQHKESGIALISAILIMVLMAGLLMGFVSMVVADQKASRSGLDQGDAYAGGHAGLEKLTADLDQLFRSNFSPRKADIDKLVEPLKRPNFGGLSFTRPDGASGYEIRFTADKDGNPATEKADGSLIAEGPYQGLIGLITPYTIDVTARTPTRAEVRMARTVQTVAIPVFQFGIFSETDLSFFAGPNFNFGGRVHTNQNLFLSEGNGNELILADRVTAVGEVVRSHLANGLLIKGTNHLGTVKIATQFEGCKNTGSSACRPLAFTNTSPWETHEGSVIIGSAPDVGGKTMGVVPPSTLEENDDGTLEMKRRPETKPNSVGWGEASNKYGIYLLNGETGARRLELPIVDPDSGAEPIDLIRRPKRSDPTGPGTTFDERFFRLASVRILLSDNADDITQLPSVSSEPPVFLPDLGKPGTSGAFYVLGATTARPPVAKSVSTDGMNANNFLIGGYLKVERQVKSTGTFVDVTQSILNLGIAGRNLARNNSWHQASKFGSGQLGACGERSASAVLRFQRVVDNPSVNDPCGNSGSSWTTTDTDYMPLALYDPREGAIKPDDAGGIRLGGIMHYVELDVKNLKAWLATQSDTMDVTGYVVYFSDRRGNRNLALTTPSKETGELGYEDFVIDNNNATPDVGEDVNGNGQLDSYGETPVVAVAGAKDYLAVAGSSTLRTIVPTDTVSVHDNARRNPTPFFRRALKLVNGGLGNLPFNGKQGLTVASENPVYVEGNFNACSADSWFECPSGGFDDPGGVHVSAAVIADAVTLLSTRWNDIRSFRNPHAFPLLNPQPDPNNSRYARTTWYRLAIISGKGLNFPWPGDTSDDFGTDGGVHNFLRYIENWGDPDATPTAGNGPLTGSTLNYRGSIVSLYTSRQAVGTFKCCGNVYSPPVRAYKFDEEFLKPNLLPPRTPMFRDINVLTFRQIFRPTEQ